MAQKCQLEVKVSHVDEGAQEALQALMKCLDDDRFWDTLQEAYQSAFRATVEKLTGESYAYIITVHEHDLERHLRLKAERYSAIG